MSAPTQEPAEQALNFIMQFYDVSCEVAYELYWDEIQAYKRLLASGMTPINLTELPDIQCPTCGREIYCGNVGDMCSTRPCGLLERYQ